MGTKERNFQPLPEDISLEDLVPEDNFYRRLQEKLDLSFVRELVEDLYAASGRPSVDPEVFFRLQLVMFHEGIRSERELMRIVSDRLSVRWYVGYDLHEPLPDHSSLTRIRDRFGLVGVPRVLRADRGGVRRGGPGLGRGAVLRRHQGRRQCLPGLDRSEVLRGGAPGRALYRRRASSTPSKRTKRARPPSEGRVADGRALRTSFLADDETRREERRKRRLDLPRRTPETRAKGRVVPAQGGLPGLRDRSRLLSDETQGEQRLPPRLLHPLRRGRWQGEDHPQRPGYSLRGHREPTDARPALAHQLPLEAPPQSKSPATPPTAPPRT